MYAKFIVSGRVGFVRFKKHRITNLKKKTKRALYLSIVAPGNLGGRKFGMWNNNFTIGSKEAEFASKIIHTGDFIVAEGLILSNHKNGKQENRFLITQFDVLYNMDDRADDHINKHGDLPPEEYYDIFDESTDTLGDNRNFFRPYLKEEDD